MKLIVGLGNPGVKYETTRHNVGFLAIDRLVDRWNAGLPVDQYEARIWKLRRDGEQVALVKPQIFMNLSGRTVGPLFGFFKCKPSDLIVIHDDLDLKPISMRLKTGGGTGGHNGLKSIDEHLGSAQNGYHRIRIGIGHPAHLGVKIAVVEYVLQPLSDDELSRIDPLLDRVADAVERILRGDVRGAMTEYNRGE